MGYSVTKLLRCNTMKSTYIGAFAGLSLALAGSIGSAHATPKTAPAEDVMACMQANLPRSFEVETFTIISESAEGSRQNISGSIYFTRENREGQLGPARAMMKIEQPMALRDSAYLILESPSYVQSGMFVYLPAVRRVRRVSGEMADGRLFGTDISYYDFKQFRNAMADLDAEYLEYQPGPRPSHRMRYRPQADVDPGFQYMIADIDAQSCLPLRIEYFDRGHLIKSLSVPEHALTRDGTRWYPAEFTLRDELRGSQTRFITQGFTSDTALPDRLFHPASFYH